MKQRQIKILLISLISLLFSACSGDNNDLVKYMSYVKARPALKIESIPQFAYLPVFKFPEHGIRRNPFKPIAQKKPTDLSVPDEGRAKQPLEEFPLGVLKLVGTLKKGTEVWALIKLPNNQVSRIRAGEYMGQNYGRVLVVKDAFLKLEETMKNSGTWEKHITTVSINNRAGE